MSQEAGLHNRSAASLGHPPHPCGFLYTRLWNRRAACPTVNSIGICLHPSQVSAFVPEASSQWMRVPRASQRRSELFAV